jgi:phenylalanyl-tRNA synthetase beta subunit
VDAIHELDISDLSNIRLVDLYQGKKLPTDRISVTIRLTFANAGCTLTQAQVNQYSDAIFSVLRKAFAAELRS